MRKAGLLEKGSKMFLIGVTAGDTKREFTGSPTEKDRKQQFNNGNKKHNESTFVTFFRYDTTVS